MLKFDRSWTIDEREGVAQKTHVGRIQLDAHAVIAGFRGCVADAVLVGHFALARNRAGAGENCF